MTDALKAAREGLERYEYRDEKDYALMNHLRAAIAEVDRLTAELARDQIAINSFREEKLSKGKL